MNRFHRILLDIIKVEIPEAQANIKGLIVNKIILSFGTQQRNRQPTHPFAGHRFHTSQCFFADFCKRNLICSVRFREEHLGLMDHYFRKSWGSGTCIQDIFRVTDILRNSTFPGLLVISFLPLIFPQPNWMSCGKFLLAGCRPNYRHVFAFLHAHSFTSSIARKERYPGTSGYCNGMVSRAGL